MVITSWCSCLYVVPSHIESVWPKYGRSDGRWLSSLALKWLQFLLCSLELHTPVKTNPCTNTQAVLCSGRGKEEPKCQPAVGVSPFGSVFSTLHQAPKQPCPKSLVSFMGDPKTKLPHKTTIKLLTHRHWAITDGYFIIKSLNLQVICLYRVRYIHFLSLFSCLLKSSLF